MNMIEAQQFSDIQVLSQDEIAEVSGAALLPVGLAAATGIVVGTLGVAFVAGVLIGGGIYAWQYYNS